tara:strand:- start:380 stop:571 length:192 start_codon:yes stop_codon:yes gene_type:complete
MSELKAMIFPKGVRFINEEKVATWGYYIMVGSIKLVCSRTYKTYLTAEVSVNKVLSKLENKGG